MKGKRVDHRIHGRMIDCHLSRFPHKSGTETLVMTEDSRMVEMTVIRLKMKLMVYM
jgi:hypothetical protein